MKKLAKEGIIGYFDVLGYQNFLKSNEIDQSIKIIENFLLTLPKDIKNQLFPYSNGEGEVGKNVNNFFKEHFNVLFIADTIIFFFDFDGIVDNDEKELFSYHILPYLSAFQNYSFENGFPMRACVDYGEFYYDNSRNKNIIGGKVIINCHIECDNLNFCGLTITKNAIDYLSKLNGNNIKIYQDEKAILKIFVRTKNGLEEKYLLDWHFGFEQEKNIYNHIFENFKKYNKTIDSKVLEKIKNTQEIYFQIENNKN
jgi:hypothetical protein